MSRRTHPWERGGGRRPLASAACVGACVVLVGAPRTSAAGPDIVGGEPSAEGAWSGVVALSGPGSGLCTGTLIHPRVVLTAAHCTSSYGSVDQVAVIVGDEVGAPIASPAVERIGTHPNFCGEPREDCADFGYLLLAEPVDEAWVVPLLPGQVEFDEWVAVGDPVTLVGFGRDDAGVSGRKREVTTPVTGHSPTGLAFLAGGEGKDTCNGDSGGPALVDRGGGDWALAGVLSYGSSHCGEGGVYGVPHAALCWIHEDSGIDVGVAGCESCDCVDLAPSAEESGCACRSSDERPWTPLVLSLAFVGAAIRRRRARGGIARRPA